MDILNNLKKFLKDSKLDLEMIENYEKVYKLSKNIQIQKNQNSLFKKDIEPNFMQKKYWSGKFKIIEESEDKGLLISATGTGKHI